MASWHDVSRIALALPEAAEESRRGQLVWRVRKNSFAWERRLRRGDIAALGDLAPDGPVLAARVPDLGAKDALIADNPEVYFTTPHFHGYQAILVWLDRIPAAELAELITEAWLARAPGRLVTAYLKESRR